MPGTNPRLNIPAICSHALARVSVNRSMDAVGLGWGWRTVATLSAVCSGSGGGGGGSGYVGGVSSGSTIAGNASMPDPDGGTMTGKEGNGLVIISW